MDEPIDTSAFAKFADELAKEFPLQAISSAVKAMDKMTIYHLQNIPEYPMETLERLMPPDGSSWLKTPQQRAWFFAAVQNGELPGWKWVDAQYGISYEIRKDPRTGGGRSYPDIRTEKKVLIEPAHPEKIGGARSGNLGRSQTQRVEYTEEEVSGYVGFDESIAPYAPWVVGDDFPGNVIGGENMYQAQIHVDRWWQFGSIIQSNLEPGWEVFNKTFWEEFSKRVQNEK